MKILRVGVSEFKRVKFSALDGSTKVSYTEPHGFKIEASPFGITFEGKFNIEDRIQLNQFAKLVADSWDDREKLAPKLYNTTTGH